MKLGTSHKIISNVHSLPQDLLQNWARNVIQHARAQFLERPFGTNYAVTLATLDQLEKEIDHLVFNFVDEL